MDGSNSFPILYSYSERKQNLRPTSVPWGMISPHEKQAMKNHGDQSLKRLSERGGLSPQELLAVLEDRPWVAMPIRDACDKILHLIRDFYRKCS